MKILYAGQSILNPVGGGEISARLLLKELAKDNEVIVFGIGARDEKELYRNDIKFYEYPIPFYVKQKFFPSNFFLENYFKKIIFKKINLVKPDIIIFQNPGLLDLKDIPKKIKTIVFIRSLDWYAIENQSEGLIKKILNLPFFIIRHIRNKKFLNNIDLVFTNSYFMQKELKRIMNVSSQVIYPFIDLEKYKTDIVFNEQRYITFINLNFHKGGDIALKIAKALPKQKFLFIEGNNPNKFLKSKIEKLNNIKSIKWVEDMRKIYKLTRLLLVPSLCREGFNRLPIETGINGIPVIASNRGGLPESVGNGGILIKNLFDINEWLKAIKKLDNRDEYKNLSLKAIINAENFDFKIHLNKFKRIVHKYLQIKL